MQTMSFLDGFLKHGVKPSTSRRKIRERPGPMTARESWALIWPIAAEIDPLARLIFVTSGLDINPKGQSFSWEYLFFLPGIPAKIMMSLSPMETADTDNAPIYLVQRLQPVSNSELKTIHFLPDKFRNSPEVISELSLKGLDFTAGPSDMKLESRVLPTGEAVWVTFYWDVELTTPFAMEST